MSVPLGGSVHGYEVGTDGPVYGEKTGAVILECRVAAQRMTPARARALARLLECAADLAEKDERKPRDEL